MNSYIDSFSYYYLKLEPPPSTPTERWGESILEICSVNFLFFELFCEVLWERNLFFLVFRNLVVFWYLKSLENR
jgi:hypothetical protein